MRIHAIPTDVVDRARKTTDEHHVRLAEAPGSPLRCCLGRSGEGEAVVLFRYSPTAGRGPYEEVGPVFVHAEPCDGPDRTDVLPEALCKASRLVRTYDAEGRIHGGGPVTANELESVLGKVLADPAVVEAQVRSLTHGCFLFAVTRD